MSSSPLLTALLIINFLTNSLTMSSSPNKKGSPSPEAAADKASERQIEVAGIADLKYDEPKVAERRVSVGVTTDDAYNPLQRLDKPALLAEADEFVNKFGLEEYRDVFRRGALVAQRPKEFLAIPELTNADRDDLVFEENHMWKNLSPLLIYSGMSLFISCVTNRTQSSFAHSALRPRAGTRPEGECRL